MQLNLEAWGVTIDFEWVDGVEIQCSG